MHIVFVLGGPGSGKGTLCQKLVQNFPDTIAHISVGQVLRNINDKIVQDYLLRGEIVPSHITLYHLKKTINNLDKKIILIDGFPRNIEQGLSLEKDIQPCSIVLSLNVSDDIMIKRLLNRAEKEGRVDDKLDIIKKRLDIYHSISEPIIEYYQDINKSFHIDASSSVKQVYNDALEVLKNIIN